MFKRLIAITTLILLFLAGCTQPDENNQDIIDKVKVDGSNASVGEGSGQLTHDVPLEIFHLPPDEQPYVKHEVVEEEEEEPTPETEPHEAETTSVDTSESETTQSEPTVEASSGAGHTTTSAQYVRSGPGSHYATLGTISYGTTYTITGVSSGWYRISYNGGHGFVAPTYFQRGEAPKSQPRSTETSQVGTTSAPAPAQQAPAQSKLDRFKGYVAAAGCGGGSSHCGQQSGRVGWDRHGC